MSTVSPQSSAEAAQRIRAAMPETGLFEGHGWRIAPTPFALGAELARELESLGRVLLQFNRAVNLLYRQSCEGKQPEWVAALLDQGKPAELIALQRSAVLKNELPRVIRPDLLLTETGISVTELDSVPGGIGLTAWLNQTYASVAAAGGSAEARSAGGPPATPLSGGGAVLGGADGMQRGFASIFGGAARVQVIVSEESATYRPEMEWLCGQLGCGRFAVRGAEFTDFKEGDGVYRFFELFDLPNVANAARIFQRAAEKRLRLTPPPKPIFEEKLLFALLWNRNLRGFWRRELGEGFLERMLKLVPYTWVLDPAPLPPHAAYPEIGLTDWNQLKTLSQRERDLILKVSGFSAEAWGARGVYLGSDLSQADWAAAVAKAMTGFARSPYVLQRYHKPRTVTAEWFDFAAQKLVAMPGRVRLCPYYFVAGEVEQQRATLGGVLATVCPADKKIIHGMTEAILAPCST